MITGQWGKPSEVLLDIVAEPDGIVRGVINPGRQNVVIREGRFDASTRAVHLEGDRSATDGEAVPFTIDGHLRGRTLHLTYRLGDHQGAVELVRVEEYRPARVTLIDLVKPWVAAARRACNSLSRPDGRQNRRRLEDRGESLDTIVFRDGVAADIPALAELHVELWNATYRTTRGPSVATRTRQWTDVFQKSNRVDFVLLLENHEGRLIGFAWGVPEHGDFRGQLSKIYLRWEYHGLGLGRRMLAESARRFLDRGIESFVLFADLGNPTVGFFDRMGGERLLDERGLFHGAFGWRDVRTLL